MMIQWLTSVVYTIKPTITVRDYTLYFNNTRRINDKNRSKENSLHPVNKKPAFSRINDRRTN